MSVREKHKATLLQAMGDPERPFPGRGELPGILGISAQAMYRHFSPGELSQIESEAVDIRKASCSRQRANVLEALYRRAMGFSHLETKLHVIDDEVVRTEVIKTYPPDRAAAQEFLDRTEGKVTEKKEITGGDGAPLVPTLNVTLTGA